MSVTTKWWFIGTQLGVKISSLRRIEADYPRSNDRCFSEMIVEWIKTTRRPTWKQILAALRTRSVNEPVLANELERKFSSEEYATDTDFTRQAGRLASRSMYSIVKWK